MGFAKQAIAALAVSAVAAAAPWACAAAQTTTPAKPAAKSEEADVPDGSGAPSAKKKDPAVAERAYAAGVKAFEAGKMGDAVQSLSVALSQGGLPAQQMAKALYFRGAAYRKQEKPAQAISDLTTAVWLKGGLSDADRAKAIEERQQAYREAGLGDTAPPIGTPPLDAPASAGGSATTKTAAAAPAPQKSFWSNLLPWGSSSQPAPTQAAPPPAPVAQQSAAQPEPAPAPQAPATETMPWQTAMQQPADAQAATPAPPAAAPAPPVVVTAAVSAPSVPDQISAGFVESSTAAPPAQPAAVRPVSTESAQSSGGTFSGVEKAVTGLFGNVFGSSAAPSGTTTASTPPSPVSTATTATSSSPPQWQDTTVAAAEPSAASTPAPEALPWTTQSAATPPPPVKMPPVIQQQAEAAPAAKPAKSKSEVAPPPVIMAAAPEVPPATALAPAPPVPVTAEAPSGRYRLQVAAVRSRDEAERLASSVMKHEALTGGGVRPEIDEAVLGSMGTFYRVRLGPYADAAEPGQLCKSLRPKGYDCLVVTQ